MSFLSNVISAADILGAIGDKVDYFNRRVRMQSGYDYKRFADGVVADNNDTAIPKESNMKDARDGGNSQLATFLSIPQSSTAGQYHRVPNRTSIVMADGSKWTFDAVDDIKYTSPSKITQFPVENKASISDHVINENPKLTFEGYFSEANSKSYQGRDNHTHSTFYKALLAMRDARSVVTITTPLDVYPNMIVDTVEFERSAQTGIGICVNLSFQKVRWVSTGTTTAWVTADNPPAPVSTVDTNEAPATPKPNPEGRSWLAASNAGKNEAAANVDSASALSKTTKATSIPDVDRQMKSFGKQLPLDVQQVGINVTSGSSPVSEWNKITGHL